MTWRFVDDMNHTSRLTMTRIVMYVNSRVYRFNPRIQIALRPRLVYMLIVCWRLLSSTGVAIRSMTALG